MKVPAWIANPKDPNALWRTVAGWACVCIGVVGLILPVIPGLPLLVFGLLLLSARFRWASACLQWVKRQARQFPGLNGKKNTSTEE
jgi:Flp pilus assembly protein TadB